VGATPTATATMMSQSRGYPRRMPLLFHCIVLRLRSPEGGGKHRFFTTKRKEGDKSRRRRSPLIMVIVVNNEQSQDRIDHKKDSRICNVVGKEARPAWS
jgi:hypothetical protein